MKKGHRESGALRGGQRLEKAIQEVQARRSRATQPRGIWVDGAWLPHLEERRPCCDRITRKGQSLQNHCRSLVHVAHLFGVPPDMLKAACRKSRCTLKHKAPRVVFARLPVVLRQLRGSSTYEEIARGTGLAANHLRLFEDRPPRVYAGRPLPATPGTLPRLDTLDLLLRYYGVSLAELGRLLSEADRGGQGNFGD